MLESGGPVDEEVKEIFDDEAMSRKLDDLCAFLFPMEEPRSPKRFPVPDILFMENRTPWKVCLYLNCQQSNLYSRVINTVKRCQDQMVLAQGFQRKLRPEMTELLITLCNFSIP